MEGNGTGRESADVVIVGARCAGSASAIALARAGRRVIALDRAAFPSDTLSTHLFFPSHYAELARLGALERVEMLGARITFAAACTQRGSWSKAATTLSRASSTAVASADQGSTGRSSRPRATPVRRCGRRSP